MGLARMGVKVYQGHVYLSFKPPTHVAKGELDKSNGLNGCLFRLSSAQPMIYRQHHRVE